VKIRKVKVLVVQKHQVGPAQVPPVSVDVRRAKGKAVVHEGGVDQVAALGLVQQVVEEADVPVAPPDHVPWAVLVQHEYLARWEPALKAQREQVTSAFKLGTSHQRTDDLCEPVVERQRLQLAK